MIRLLMLTDEHRGAIEYDLRAHLGTCIAEVGVSIPWAEYGRLLQRLAANPATWLHAELAGWAYPVSREWAALYQQHALLQQLNAKKPHRYLPAPWDKQPKRIGTPIARERLDAILAAQRERPAEGQTPTA